MFVDLRLTGSNEVFCLRRGTAYIVGLGAGEKEARRSGLDARRSLTAEEGLYARSVEVLAEVLAPVGGANKKGVIASFEFVD